VEHHQLEIQSFLFLICFFISLWADVLIGSFDIRLDPSGRFIRHLYSRLQNIYGKFIGWHGGQPQSIILISFRLILGVLQLLESL